MVVINHQMNGFMKLEKKWRKTMKLLLTALIIATVLSAAALLTRTHRIAYMNGYEQGVMDGWAVGREAHTDTEVENN
jgi:uncharacterized membrane protein